MKITVEIKTSKINSKWRKKTKETLKNMRTAKKVNSEVFDEGII
jgi:hypothetical protein